MRVIKLNIVKPYHVVKIKKIKLCRIRLSKKPRKRIRFDDNEGRPNEEIIERLAWATRGIAISP